MSDWPSECPSCGESVYRWYAPTYDLSIYGEDIGVDVRMCVTDRGLAMHVYDDLEGGEFTPDSGVKLRD